MNCLIFFKQTLKKNSFRFIKKTEPKLQQFPIYTPPPTASTTISIPHQMVHLFRLMNLHVCVCVCVCERAHAHS